MRTKKKARDKLYTQAFFGQLPACTCPHTHGIEHGPCVTEARRSQPYTDLQRDIGPATKTLLEATIAHEETQKTKPSKEGPTQPPGMGAKAFALVDLEKVMDDFDQVVEEFENAKTDNMEDMVYQLRSTRKAAEEAEAEEGKDCMKAVVARAQAMIAKQQAINEIVDFSVSRAKLFNVEKRFEFVDEAYGKISGEYEERHGVDPSTNREPSFKALLNAPTKHIRGDTKEQKEKRPRKKLDLKTAMVQMKRHCMLATNDLHAMNRTISDEDLKPSMTDALANANLGIPSNLPRRIRESLYDLEFVYDEIPTLREDVMAQRDQMRCTMMIWMSTSKHTWEYAKNHIHELPDMQRYEYLRNSLSALYWISFRKEAIVLGFFMDNDITQAPPRLSAKLVAGLQIGKRAQAEVMSDWDTRLERLKATIISLNEMVIQLEEVEKNIDAEANGREDDWWKVLAPKVQA